MSEGECPRCDWSGERYELRYAVGHRYARDLRTTLGIPKSSRIAGASFQVGKALDGRDDVVVLLIEPAIVVE